jgi:hypothetical protein
MGVLVAIVCTLIGSSFAVEYPVPLLPDASSIATHKILDATKKNKDNEVDPIIESAIQVGAKNLAWLKFINATRAEDDQIQLTNPGDLPKYPIEAPSYNSPKLIADVQEHARANMPLKMRQVLFENGDLTSDIGTSLEEYVRWARKIDDNYADAGRWKLMYPMLDRYAMFSYLDIRGYYYLQKEENVEEKLKKFSSLSSSEQEVLASHLVGICHNTKLDKASCRLRLGTAIKNDSVFYFYQKYIPAAESLYNSFFRISVARQDIVWNAKNPDLATIPFRTTSSHIEKFLTDNIEEEWQWENWKLVLDFTKDALLHVEFVPNVLPHVPENNTIIMDENAPLTEWNVRWIIRHEFGHTIGFEDCYVEYYDVDTKEMINYQLDITDIMCSRDGKFQQKHYDELRRVYFKDSSPLR